MLSLLDSVAASNRVIFFTTRVLVTLHFRLQISISCCSFLQSADELLEFTETWGFAISFASLEIDLNIYMLVQSSQPSRPTYADPPPVLRHWHLVLKYSRY